MKMQADISKVERGDIVRFKSYALRVEQEPKRGNGSITLTGRISVDGSPIVTKHFMNGRMVLIERESAPKA
jgi:hypothetical protein